LRRGMMLKLLLAWLALDVVLVVLWSAWCRGRPADPEDSPWMPAPGTDAPRREAWRGARAWPAQASTGDQVPPFPQPTR
jgi:hypothetical protein